MFGVPRDSVDMDGRHANCLASTQSMCMGNDAAEGATCGGARSLLEGAASTLLVDLVPFGLLECPFLSALCNRLLG